MRRRRPVSRFWLALLLTILLLQGALSTVHGSTYSDAVLADSPASYYRFGEPSGTMAADASGNNNTATYHNNTLGAAGALQSDSDTAVTFDGASAYISVPSLALTGSFAVEFWAKSQQVAGGWAVPIQIFQGWNNDEYFVFEFVNDGSFKIEYRNTGSIVSAPFNLTDWHHVVYSYDGDVDTGTLYVDGTHQGSSANGPLLVTNPTIEIGDFQSGYWYKGAMDEVAFYGHTLSEERVQAHYAAAGYSLNPTPTATATETLTPTPAPWALATLPGSGLTYQVSYEVSVGDVMQFVALLVLIALSFIQMLVTMANRR
jgi:hypothetical protein